MAPKAKSSKDATAAPKKEKKPKESAGFMGWDDADDDADQSGGFKQGKITAPLDKRRLQADVKEEKVITGGSDAASMLLKKQAAVKKDDKAKKAADQKIKDSVKAERKGGDGLGEDDGDGDDESFQILDKSGLGNFMDRADVLEIMKNTVSEAVTSSGSRSQIVTKISDGDRVYLGDAKKAPVFESVGGFKTNKGFVYIRGKQDEPGFGVKFVRPCTMYVCLSEPPNEDDSYMRRWEEVSPDELAPPDLGDGVAEIAIIKKRKFTDRMGSIPKPPEGYETCLCFVKPDFHADVHGSEELSKEEQLALDRKNKQLARDEKDKDKADKDKGKGDKKKDEPTEEEVIEAIKAKVAAGTKLTSKEKKALEKWNDKHPTYEVHAEDRSLVDSSLNAFSVVIEGGCNPPPAGDSLVVDSFSLQAPGQHLFVNASFTIAQGKRYGILGPNGQGKTTLLRHIAAREFPVPTNWDVILVEQEAKASSKSAVEEVMASNEAMFKLGQLEQELIDKLDQASEAAEKGGETMSAAECESVQQELSRISAELEASGADSAEAAVRKILCGLGFTNGGGKVGSVTDRFSMDRPVQEFSGGWRMRISLAKALYLCPKLLMLDEPTNHLDLDAVLWLDDYLSTKYPHAVIVVSHDADFLDHIVTDILHLENKQLLHYRGDYTAFRKMHQQKARETASIYKKQQDEIKLLKKKGANKDDAEAKVKAKYKINSLDDLMEKPKDYLVKFNFRGHGQDQSIGGVNVTDVSFSYNGKEPWLLEECEMGVDCASRIAIVGPNGAGKTTMLNLMLCQLEPSKGEVQIAKGLRVRNYHQHFEELLPFEKDPTTHLRDMYNLNPEKARAVLGQFGLPGASHHTKIGNLSGGQKARVAFGELMLSEPHIMILDEPTNHLDIESVEALTQAITNFNGGLVIVSHDARLITEIDAQIWVVEDGTCYRFEKGFDGYRDKVLRQLEERQAEVERLEAKRREVKAAKRAALVTKEQAEHAKKKAEEQKKMEEERQAELLKQAQADAAAAKAKAPKKKEVVDEPIEEGSDEDAEEAKSDDGKDKSDSDSEKGSEKDDSEDEEDIDYTEKHDEFKVAMLVSVRVKKVNVGKKDKEFKVFLCELDIGEDDNISAVTMYSNAMAGEKVIVALAGSTVEDAKVEAEMVHGEYNQAVICGAKEMGWTVPKSEATKCAILEDSFEVGQFAPKRIKFEKDGEDEEEGKDKVGGDKADAKAVPQKKKDAPSAAADAKSKKGKKADNDDDEDNDGDGGAPNGPAADADQDKKKKKGKPGKGEDDVKVGRSAAKKAQADKEEAEKKEKAEAAAKAKGKKGKSQLADDEDVPMEKVKGKKDAPEAVKQDAAGGDPNAKHPEYKVAKVTDAVPQKKGGKFVRGWFVVSISLGNDGGNDDITVITSHDLAVGNRVVFAPEGSTVSGKEVKKQKVQGEWTFGVFCTPMDLSWPGDAGRCVLLSDAWTVGDFAPLNAPKDLGVIAVDEVDEDEMSEGATKEEEDEVDYSEINDGKKKGAAKAAPKAKGKAAKGKKGKKGDVEDDEDQDDDAAGGKPKAKAEPKPKGAPPAPKAKAKGKKGKKGDSDEEFAKKDVPVAVAKKAPTKKVDSDSDDAPIPARKGGFAAVMDSDDENADSESEEEEKPVPKKEPIVAAKKEAPAAAAKDKSKKDERDDSDSEEDDKAAKKKAAKEKENAKAKKKKVESSEEESSDEDEKKAAAARKKALEKLKEKAKGKKKKAESSEDESSEDEKAKKKKAKEREKAKAKKKKESSSEDESSEDEKAKKKKAAAKEKEKAKAKKKKESSSDAESSEDEKAKKKKASSKEKEKADKEKSKAKKKKDDSDDEGAAFDFGDKKKKDKKKKADSDSDDDKKKKKEKKDKK